MKNIQLAILIASLVLTQSLHGSALQESIYIRSEMSRRVSSQIEPNAGNWRTWVISSGRDFRVPPPPSPEETQAELRLMSDLINQNSPQVQQQIKFWDAGAAPYRWMDLINSRILAGTATTQYPHRVYAYVALAMYDATIATWESKYFYNRRRPSRWDHHLPTAVEVANSPSYPSEHSAVAAAAATVLAHFLPAEAASFQTQAEQAGWSRVLAGVQFPSDHYAGIALGQRVAEQVIAKADTDGSALPWTGTVPTGPCKWIGTNPNNVTGGNWRPLLLTSPSQFRPPPPPDCTSPELQSQLAEVRNFPRSAPGTAATFVFRQKAFYWQAPEGANNWVYRYADKWISEDRLDRNPPRVARIYALLAAVQFDAFIASQDGKFTYWYIRPSQLDPTIVPLFPVPNFPSYPSNHSTYSAARAEILAYLFPTRADFARALGKEAGDSRIWAGIHYQMDNVAGVDVGRSVAQVFIARAESDGSQ